MIIPSAILQLLILNILMDHSKTNEHDQYILLVGGDKKTQSHAIENNYKVIYREAHIFFSDLFEQTQLGNRKKILRLFSEADLLVIDDLFLRKKLPQDAADELQEILLNRYSVKKSTLITSNRVLEDWGVCLKDNAVSSAILDRLLHHGHLLKFQGRSYRLKEAASMLVKRKN